MAPTRRLNVRSACSGRSNDRPLGGIRRLGRGLGGDSDSEIGFRTLRAAEGGHPPRP